MNVRSLPSRAGRGRPRNAEYDTSIIEATLALLAEEGVPGLSMDALAARAGVGKATIYRRWPTKDALIVDALAHLTEEPVQVSSTGTVRDDLVELAESVRRKGADSLASRIMPRLFAAGHNEELHRLYYERVIRPRRERVAEVLRRGVDTGELRADLNIEQTIDLLAGPIVYRTLVCSRHDVQLSRGYVQMLVDTVLDGVRKR